ncbi:Hypothetical protein CulFRC58_1319 [Corynebacterium ulcerans FRC58]|uniref:Uncharacterized protein n=1 Tax=Corynebacterium ulcerans FRC58 TaxID=1408268 RepID=A0ABM5U144_CORUL|nr:Hypothetical protein CulFRC58_1319 [Corynebacterium ulcerans FRC58]
MWNAWLARKTGSVGKQSCSKRTVIFWVTTDSHAGKYRLSTVVMHTNIWQQWP